MNQAPASLVMMLMTLFISNFAQATTQCAIIAQQKDINHVYFVNQPVSSALIKIEDFSSSVGNVLGQNFIPESKYSMINFSQIYTASDSHFKLQLKFTRWTKMKKNSFMSELKELGQVELNGQESKVIELDQGRYQVTITCAKQSVE